MKPLIFLVAALFFQSCFAQNSTKMLSKADASRLFSQSFQDWKAQVESAQKLGVAVGEVSSKYEITLAANTPMGILFVTPTYSNGSEDKPNRILVTVRQSKLVGKLTRALSEDAIRDIVQQTQNEMLPEFTVLTKVNLKDESVQYDFFIFEVGVHPLLDETSKASKGCWQQCIIK